MVIPTAGIDLDETHPSFSKTSGEQTLAPKPIGF